MNDRRLRLTKQWLKRHGPLGSRAHAPKRIGIYAGAFDPVHVGHIGFALQALEAARLDGVIFLPERRPVNKPSVEHYAHRVAMLTRALAPHPKLSVMEMVDRRYTVKRTLPELEVLFPGDKLVFLMGSDALRHLPEWPHAERLLKRAELVVGVRSDSSPEDTANLVASWPVQPLGLTVFKSFAPGISSAEIRQALRANASALGLLSSVRRYAKQQWLYVSVR
jgi:nicotinate-nucleotide adenylyltransferase